jgi:hypothetical protein
MPISRRDLLGTAVVFSISAGLRHSEADEADMRKVVLLGDSVFDNASYVGGGPDVIAQLRQRLPHGWTAELLAVDGSVMAGVIEQAKRLPADATHLIVSMGGNDALRMSSVLGAPSTSVADTLITLSTTRDDFCADYRATLGALSASNLPLAVCTIYDVRYPNPTQRRISIAALSLINDCIIREAAARGIPVVDLRLICSEDDDFANPIEPSEKGGGKIADAIVALLQHHDFSSGRSQLFVR